MTTQIQFVPPRIPFVNLQTGEISRPWEDFLRGLFTIVGGSSGAIDHATLTNLDSASYTHLSAVNATDLIDGGDTLLHYHASDRNSANFTGINWTDLTDAGDSALHYHSADRSRANHTGTQLKSTISDFPSFPVYLFNHFADVGNVGTGEDDLYSDTIAAGQLASNGDRLEVEYGGTFVNHATATRQLKIYFGGTLIFDTGALTISAASAWTIRASLIRVSASVIRYMVSMNTMNAALAAYTAVGEVTGLTLSGTNVLKITSESAGVGAASNDIVAKLGSVVYRPI